MIVEVKTQLEHDLWIHLREVREERNQLRARVAELEECISREQVSDREYEWTHPDATGILDRQIEILERSPLQSLASIKAQTLWEVYYNTDDSLGWEKWSREDIKRRAQQLEVESG